MPQDFESRYVSVKKSLQSESVASLAEKELETTNQMMLLVGRKDSKSAKVKAGVSAKLKASLSWGSVTDSV